MAEDVRGPEGKPPELHPLLRRQLRKSGLPETLEGASHSPWHRLLQHVNLAYQQADQDRYTLERSISISSREMQELYRDLQHSQLLLAQERDRLDGILGSLRDVVWSARPDHQALLYVNASFRAVFGRAESELYAHPALWQDLAIPEDRPKTARAKEALMREGFWDEEYRIRRSDGAERWLHHKMQLIRNPSGIPLRIDSICSDITDRKAVELETLKAMEAAESLSRMKTQFLANMSHEIRTPMNGVVGMVQLLMGTCLTEEQRRMAQVILDSSHSLLGILNDILDLTKLEHGKLAIRLEPFGLRRTLEDVADLMRPQAAGKGLRFRLDLSPDLPATVVGDALRLRQIILNLLGNAIKFTEQGEVEVMADLQGNPHAGWTLRCEVRDTGAGIPPDAQLFLPFNQADPSFTRKHGGAGLGLFISKELVERMHGKIGYDSRPGEGSRFWFTLPLELHQGDLPSLPAPAQSAAPSGSVPQAARPEASLLVAEDNLVNQRVFRTMLEHLGYGCRMVSNGREALEAMSLEAYDLVFMDCQMPVMDGYEAVRRAREGVLAHKGVIIAMTAHALVGDREKCIRAGMDDYLAKPISLDVLERMLGKWLNPLKAPPGSASGRRLDGTLHGSEGE